MYSKLQRESLTLWLLGRTTVSESKMIGNAVPLLVCLVWAVCEAKCWAILLYINKKWLVWEPVEDVWFPFLRLRGPLVLPPPDRLTELEPISHKKALMPYKSPEDPSNLPVDPMWSPRRPPWPLKIPIDSLDHMFCLTYRQRTHQTSQLTHKCLPWSPGTPRCPLFWKDF